MNAGRLRNIVVIQHQTATTNDLGEPAVEWTALGTARCEVRPLSGRAYMEARQAQSEVSHLVVMRFRGDLTADCRLLHGARVFQIEAIINVGERNKELHVMCVERTGGQA